MPGAGAGTVAPSSSPSLLLWLAAAESSDDSEWRLPLPYLDKLQGVQAIHLKAYHIKLWIVLLKIWHLRFDALFSAV